MNKHPWTRVPHYNFDFCFHVRSVTVNETLAACAFLVLKRTLIKAHEGILFELLTFGAEFTVGVMMVFAVDVYHVANGFLFTLHPFVFWVRRLRLHYDQVLRASYSNKGLPVKVRVIESTATRAYGRFFH